MRRITKWQSALGEFLKQSSGARFAWGSHDCCIFAADAVRAITDVDVAESFRGYATKDEAREILKARGGIEGLADSVALEYSLPERTPASAQRGDVVLVRGGMFNMTALGFLALNSQPAVVSGRGWRYVPRDNIVRAWGIW